MPIHVSQVIQDALSGSFIWEEYLGDFKRARGLAEDQLRVAGNDQENAEAHFGLGIVQLLRGQVRRARQHWDIAEAINFQSESWVLLLASFRHLADYEQWNTKLDGTGAEAIEVNGRWDVAEVMQKQIPRLNQLRDSCPDIEAKNLSWTLNEIYGIAKNTRSTAQHWQTAPFSEEALQLFEQVLQNMLRSANVAIRDGLKSYIVLPLWLRADIFKKSSRTELADEALTQAENAAREQKDHARLALCRLSRADWLAAGFSTPLAWDFAIIDSSLENSNLAAQIEYNEWPALSEDQLRQAQMIYEEALQRFRKAGAMRGVAQTQLRLAYLSARAGNWSLAETYIDRAEDLFRNAEDYRGVMLSRTHRILVRLWQGKWHRLTDAAQTIGRWGRWSDDFSFTHSLGILINRFARHLFIRHGRYEAARLGYQAAATLFEALQAPINATQNRVDLALLHEAVGDFTTAGPEILHASARFLQLVQSPPAYWPFPQVVRSVLLQHAIMLTSKAYNISNGLMDWEQMRNARDQLKTFVKLLNPDGVLPDKLPETVEETRLFAMTHLALSLEQEASVLIPYYQYKLEERKINQFSAEQFWKTAYQKTETMPEERRLFYQTVLWGAKRNYELAAQCHDEYLKLKAAGLPELSAAETRNTHFLHDDDLKTTKHRHFWEQAFGMWVKLTHFDRALEAWEKRCDLEDEQWWERENAPWRTGSYVAEMYEGLAKYDLAFSYCERCLEMLDQRRTELSRDELRTAIANDRGAQYLYHLGARLAIQQHDPEKAFFYIEQGKARALLDLLSAHPDRLSLKEQQQRHVQKWREGNAKLQAFRGLFAVERRQSQPDEVRVRQLEQEIKQTAEAVRHIEQKLLEEVPTFFSTVGGSGKILRVTEVQELLEEDQLFIVYSYYEDDLFIWAINREGLQAISLEKIPVKKIRDLSLELHHACQSRSDYSAPAEVLADYLLKPVQESLAQHSQVYLAPSGSLFLVPFQILPFQNKPLGETHLLSFLPNASSLQYFPKIKLPTGSQALVVGNPTGDLEAAAIEASFIAQLFQTQALLGSDATEKAVRRELSRANILHLATHGYLSEEAPLASSLALAGASQLSLYELMGMQLEAELVVLSACETGKGSTTNGDDVVGLTRGLLAAGAKSAIVSFWSVDDASTALFMKYFYQHLQEFRSPPRALAFAQMKLRQTSQKLALRDLDDSFSSLSASTQRSLRGIKLERTKIGVGYEHPFYWAPFFYVGRL